MKTQMGSEEVDVYRSLKKTAIVVMLLFRLDRPTGENEIARLLAMSPVTVRSYLRSLARLGVVTRTHRYQGWVLTAGGRQMILGESNQRLLVENIPVVPAPEEEPVEIKASDKNCRSRAVVEAESGASDKNCRSREEIAQSSVKNCRSSDKNCRSQPSAAASLSLSFKQESFKAAAAKGEASVKNCRSSDKISRSLAGRRDQEIKVGKRAAGTIPDADSRVQANLEAFASIGVTKNDYILEICRMKHVTPRFILGQKKRLESERRYSRGLLLTVIRCNDFLPEKYLACKDRYAQPDIPETEPEPEEEAGPIPKFEPDPSVHEALSENGMTAMKAWSAALGQLKADMLKATYDQWVRDSFLLSARDGIFVIGAGNDYACEWMTSRLSSTIRRLLTGICNQAVEVKFVNAFGIED